MARRATRRIVGALEPGRNKDTEAVTRWRARYVGPDMERHHEVFGDKMAAEAWLNDEPILIGRGEWKPPRVREREARLAKQRAITLAEWAERSMVNKKLRSSTRHRYERMLEQRILPELGEIPLADLTWQDVANWYTRLAAATMAAEAKARKANWYRGTATGVGSCSPNTRCCPRS